MPRLLSQLECGHCARRFWPRSDDAVVPVIHCPHCAGGHSHPGALPTRPGVDGHPLGDWLNRHWLGVPPRQLGALQPRMGRDEGLHWCAVRRVQITAKQQTKMQYVLQAFVVAEFPAGVPPSVQEFHPALGNVRLQFHAHGAEVESRGGGDAEAALAAAVQLLIRSALKRGARSLAPLLEVSDPRVAHVRAAPPLADPARDARVESEAIRCGDCGAPSSLAYLVGDAQCAFCGAHDIVDDARAREFKLYVRRRAAAGLASHAPAPTSSAGSGVTLCCAFCGTPNSVRPGRASSACASCRSPLIPHAAARQAEIAAQVDRRRAAFGSTAMAASQRRGAQQRLLRRVKVACAVMFLLATAGVATVYFLTILTAVPLGARIALSAAALLCLLVAGAVSGLVFRRGKRLSERFDQHLHSVSEQLCMSSLGTGGLARWAGRFWNDRVRDVWTESRFTLAGSVRGLPVVVLVRPAARGLLTALARIYSARVPPPHIVVLVGATLRPEAPAIVLGGLAAEIVERLTEAGFQAELRTGGLALRMPTSTVHDWFRAPEKLGSLGRVAHLAAGLAHELSAVSST